MKKIIATVLAMVMALALCTTAFAAPTTLTTKAKAYRDTSATEAVKSPVGEGAWEITVTYTPATTPTLVDGKQTDVANVAYYTVSRDDSFNTAYGQKKYVAVGSLAEADLVLYADADAKSVMLYLAENAAFYAGTGTKFTNFGDKCGQYNITPVAGETYYTNNASNAVGDALYVTTDVAGQGSLLVDGKVVNVTLVVADLNDALVKHVAIPTTDANGKVTAYTCSKCGAKAVKAANVASIPSGAFVIESTWYFPAVADNTNTNNGSASSPKTFDAGIAMYVGMALTSVAGSAVVIGKKKEF